jgi:hypothetical protein
LKECNFRKIPLKDIGSVKYHRNIAPSPANSIPSRSGANAGAASPRPSHPSLPARPRLPAVAGGLAMATTRPRRLSPSNCAACLLQLRLVDHEAVAQECSLVFQAEPRFPHRRTCSSAAPASSRCSAATSSLSPTRPPPLPLAPPPLLLDLALPSPPVCSRLLSRMSQAGLPEGQGRRWRRQRRQWAERMGRATRPATTNDGGEGVAVASRKERRAGSAFMASGAGSGCGGASMAPGRRRELRGAAVSSAAVQEVARVSELRG